MAINNMKPEHHRETLQFIVEEAKTQGAKVTIQEEIREGITGFVLDYGKAMETECCQYPEFIVVDRIIAYLHAKGVVIKVDKKLPDTDPCLGCELNDGHEHTCHGRCLEQTQYKARAGYVAVESLIID